MSGAKRASRTRVRPEGVKSEFPLSVHLRYAVELMRGPATAEERARILSRMLVATADALADPGISTDRRQDLTRRVNRLWRYTFFGAVEQGGAAEIVALVAGIASSAAHRERDCEGRLFYLNIGLMEFRMFSPERASRFNEEAVSLFQKAVVLWNARGRAAGKWRSIARVAESIGIRRTAEQIRRTWEDAHRSPRIPKRGIVTGE